MRKINSYMSIIHMIKGYLRSHIVETLFVLVAILGAYVIISIIIKRNCKHTSLKLEVYKSVDKDNLKYTDYYARCNNPRCKKVVKLSQEIVDDYTIEAHNLGVEDELPEEVKVAKVFYEEQRGRVAYENELDKYNRSNSVNNIHIE